MRRSLVVVAAAALALIGCPAAEERPAVDSAAGEQADRNTTLAAFSGDWNVRAMPEQGDSTLVTYVVRATNDTSGWTITFPNREPIPMRVLSVAGDSVVLEVGPYESALRPNVQVITRSVNRVQGDRMIGTAVARYQNAGADSVRRLRIEGTRAP